MAFVGSNGVFGQTFDDQHWSERGVAPGDLYTVTCVNALVGWAAGASGFVATTLDGGQTWATRDLGVSANLRAIRFGDASLGVAAGDQGALVVTRDGGSTWTRMNVTGANLRGAAVATGTASFFVGGDGGALLRSSDAGHSWQTASLPLAGDITGVASDTAGHLLLAADSDGNVWASTDGALTFRREVIAPAALLGITVSDDGTRGLAVGAHGTALERAADGQWSVVPTGTVADLRAALITNGNTRDLVAGASGTLLESADHGAHWAQIVVTTEATLYGLDDL